MGTSIELSSAGIWFMFVGGSSPSNNSASKVSLISAEVAGVNKVLLVRATSGTSNSGSACLVLDASGGSGVVSVLFHDLLLHTGLGTVVGLVINLDRYLSAAMHCFEGLQFQIYFTPSFQW